jgi:hypothetical protein
MVKLLKLSIFWLNATTATHIETYSIQSVRKTIEGIYNTREHVHLYYNNIKHRNQTILKKTSLFSLLEGNGLLFYIVLVSLFVTIGCLNNIDDIDCAL